MWEEASGGILQENLPPDLDGCDDLTLFSEAGCRLSSGVDVLTLCLKTQGERKPGTVCVPFVAQSWYVVTSSIMPYNVPESACFIYEEGL
ncbi:hypothetical protein KSX_54710 [Ktedonospora formicarum]|uniref:Uncharacterized protein n=1 Tax=Ktedonospora formicarum TaxID=2778364 RepID=A0A8J3MV49_9CHLR|nr:hypothetical protein KSX_54710 [Ktedonospora formicarum]